MCGASPGSTMRMYGEVPHPPLRSTAICLQKLCTGAEVNPRSDRRRQRRDSGNESERTAVTMDAAPTESHGKLAPVSPTDAFQFHLVFSNKTETDGYCLGIWTDLTARGVQVWQQKKNIPKDSDNWFSEWFPSAQKSKKIICFINADYLTSP